MPTYPQCGLQESIFHTTKTSKSNKLLTNLSLVFALRFPSVVLCLMFPCVSTFFQISCALMRFLYPVHFSHFPLPFMFLMCVTLIFCSPLRCSFVVPCPFCSCSIFPAACIPNIFWKRLLQFIRLGKQKKPQLIIVDEKVMQLCTEQIRSFIPNPMMQEFWQCPRQSCKSTQHMLFSMVGT